ncbi:hypothetical protein [Salininema proteolyticum]|uniref:MYXO-CTERM domain-containing protein n=1 Tax=Salininema proteolyticum TaxID=1607685 RepID=A0ABV8TTP1_9ACTN
MVFQTALTAAALAVAAPLPAAAEEQACTGVTVVVDFPDGTTASGCADDPGNGLEALTQAGFTVTEVNGQAGMVCRIDERPETSCAATPSQDEYWSYWTAGEGDEDWTYAQAGPSQARPGPGSSQGWTFGDGETEPSRPPAAAPVGERSDEKADGYWWIAAPVLIVLVAAAAIVVRRRNAD